MEDFELVEINNGVVEIKKEVLEKIRNYESIKAKMDVMYDQLKSELLEAVESFNAVANSHVENNFVVQIRYNKPTTRTTVDSKKLKEQHPDIYKNYSKVSNVKSSISLKVEV